MTTPRHHTPRNLDRATRGGEVKRLAYLKGKPLMPWQQRAVDVALEIDPATGLYWYRNILITVPRQAGKTKLEGDIADHRCLSIRSARVWITAQTGKDASAWMRDEHHAALEDVAAFRGRYTPSKRAGQEGVAWPATRSTFRVFAPLRDALHGKQGDLILIDEAWALGEQQGLDVEQATTPTMNTRPGAQRALVSTRGDNLSVWFEDHYANAVALLGDPNSRTCLIDYGLGEGEDPEDLELVAARHPGIGYAGFDMATLRAAREAFRDNVAGWARAYGNVPTNATVLAFPPSAWTTAGAPRPDTLPDRFGVGVDVTPDGARLALALAWHHDDGTVRVELVHADQWTPTTLHGFAALGTPAYDPTNPAALHALETSHLTGTPIPAREYASACLRFRSGIIGRSIRHHHQLDLDAAAASAATSPKGDGGFAWRRATSSGSIAELVAATLAVRSLDTLPTPAPKPRVRGVYKRA